MKHISKKFIITALLLCIAVSGIFAAAIKESSSDSLKVKEIPDFASMDLQKESLETIMQSFAADVSDYKTKYASIYEKMITSYSEGNVDDYFDAKGMMRNLSLPAITAEQTEILTQRIVDEKDESLKATFAAWLYENSRYYHPTLTFSKSDDSESGHSHYRFSYQISSEPGSTVTLPSMRTTFTSDGIFAGWGYDSETVVYEAGSEITMPYEDVTLYAVYKSGILFTDSVTGTEVFADGDNVNAPSLTAPDDSFKFVGWYDSDGKKAEGAATFEKGESAVYTAAWKSILIEDIRARHYPGMTVPADKEFSLNFYIYNQGNTSSGKLSIELVPEKEDSMNVSGGTLTTKGISAGADKSGSFSLKVYGNSGDVVKASIVATDADGNTWSTPVEITIK